MKYLLILSLLVSCKTSSQLPPKPNIPEYGDQKDCCNRVWQIGHDTLYFIGYIKK